MACEGEEDDDEAAKQVPLTIDFIDISVNGFQVKCIIIIISFSLSFSFPLVCVSWEYKYMHNGRGRQSAFLCSHALA